MTGAGFLQIHFNFAGYRRGLTPTQTGSRMTCHHNHDGNAATNLHARAESAKCDGRMSIAAGNLGLSTRLGVSEAANHHALEALRA
jgi:hypothetical protein